MTDQISENKCCSIFTKESFFKAGRSILLILLQIAIMIIMFCIYDLYRKPHVGVVNITSIGRQFVENQRSKNVSNVELRVQLESFTTSIEKILKEVSSDKHAILIPSEVVLAGATDYTKEVEARLSKTTKAQPIQKQSIEKPQAAVEQVMTTEATKPQVPSVAQQPATTEPAK